MDPEEGYPEEGYPEEVDPEKWNREMREGRIETSYKSCSKNPTISAQELSPKTEEDEKEESRTGGCR